MVEGRGEGMTDTKCPRCDGPMALPRNWAISRTDDKTTICEACGTDEFREVRFSKLTLKRNWASRITEVG